MTSCLNMIVAVSVAELAVMVLSVLMLVVLAIVTFVFSKYLPIISNLFMDVTINPRPSEGLHLEGETVRFKTDDGIELVGTLTPGDETQPVIVFCHEFSSDRHAAARYVYFLLDAGFRIFAFDFRAHGDSPAPKGYVSRLWVTGAERADLRGALDYLRKRRDVNHDAVGLFGVSRGGVVALSGAVEDPMVKVVVADGAYSAFRTLYDYMRKWTPIFARVRWVYRHHPDWFYNMLGWLVIRLSELRMRARVLSLEKVLKELRVPALLVHGERDNYLDVTQARHLAAINPEAVNFWIVPKAKHNEAVAQVPDEYSRRLTDMFSTHLMVPVSKT